MAKKKAAVSGTASFDVLYDDGSRSSNRKLPLADLDNGLGNELEAAKSLILAHDTKIAALSGMAPKAIKQVARSGKLK
ncbi:MAG: hypothetical protein ACOVVK_18750 [Elsteraceae bacterium]